MASINDILGGLLGQPSSDPNGLLGQSDYDQARKRALLQAGAAMLQASGPSTQRVGLGQVIGQGLTQGIQANDQSLNQALQTALIGRQLKAKEDAANKPSKDDFAPTVDESGNMVYTPVAQIGGKRVGVLGNEEPAAMREWKAYQLMTPEQQAAYLNMKRASPWSVQTIGGVPTGVQGPVGGGPPKVTPLSTLDNESAAKAKLAADQASAEANAKIDAEAKGLLTKKSRDANSTLFLLDTADPLIDIATGSATGAARDKVAAVFGEAPKGAQAISQLKVIQSGLMLSMPRMEGPQSDKDVQLYKEAAGQIGDPTVPAPVKKAAISVIRTIQSRYSSLAGGKPNRIRVDANGNVVQ